MKAGKHNVLGVLVDALDYDAAVARVITAALERRPMAVTALAVHGVMTGVGDKAHRHRLNNFDLVTPDGQPVRWALNMLHKLGLRERVYGPTLTLKLCAEAARQDIPVFFYGSREDVLERLAARMTERFPGLVVAGLEASKFRQTSKEEQEAIAQRILESGAGLTFVGLGCPRQEVFAYEYRDMLRMPVLAVGAAFDYHAGLLKEPPTAMQKWGLQWLYRLGQEPGRLWRRYLLLNSAFSGLLLLQLVKLWRPDSDDTEAPAAELLYG